LVRSISMNQVGASALASTTLVEPPSFVLTVRHMARTLPLIVCHVAAYCLSSCSLPDAGRPCMWAHNSPGWLALPVSGAPSIVRQCLSRSLPASRPAVAGVSSFSSLLPSSTYMLLFSCIIFPLAHIYARSNVLLFPLPAHSTHWSPAGSHV
jgi:hypothetical protein